MSRDIHFYMLLIGLLFVFLGIFFNCKGKKISQEIMILRKRYYSDECKKNARKRKLKKVQKIYGVCKRVCLILPIFIFLIIIIFINVNKAIMRNKIEAVVVDTGGEIARINLLETFSGDQGIEETVEERFSAMPCWELYHDNSKSGEKKRQAYVDAVSKKISDKENWILENYVVTDPRGKNERELYDANKKTLDEMELERAGESKLEDVQQGKVPPLPISGDTAKTEADMRWQNYVIKQEVSMLQQASKASADAAIGFSKDSSLIEMTVQYAVYAVNGYLLLMRYKIAGESKADCCFWIAKIFRILSDTLPEEWGGLVEHCEMLSYAFCEIGVSYLETLDEKNDHANELLKLYDEMDARTQQ